MSLFNRPAPVEPSAEERTQPPRCDCCGRGGWNDNIGPAVLDGIPVKLCHDAFWCIERAKLAGRWLVGAR